jgi:hypothetical protein
MVKLTGIKLGALHGVDSNLASKETSKPGSQAGACLAVYQIRLK